VWDVSDDERDVMDCRVVRVSGGYVLKVWCDTPSGTSRHILRTAEAVERFLNAADNFGMYRSTDVESWDADMGP
jgi:hypothetical protein